MSATGCETFDKWCAINDHSPLPAMPAAVAAFVSDIAAMGVARIWPMIGTISRAHYTIGLADPTLGGTVSAALNQIAKIEPPRSWPKEHKFRFAQLPYDLQLYVAAHQAERETELRRAHSEAATLRNELKQLKSKEATDGNEPHATAA